MKKKIYCVYFVKSEKKIKVREIIVNITFNNSDDHFAKKEKKF